MKIYKYLKSGLKFKKYYEINNLNYHNTQTGIYHFRKKKELENKEMKIIEVKDENHILTITKKQLEQLLDGLEINPKGYHNEVKNKEILY